MYNTGNKNYNQALAILSTLFFIWGLITVLNFMLVEKFMIIFSLSSYESYFLNVAFFGAYLLVSYPSGKLIDLIGYKTGMVMGILIGAFGCFLFCPAAAYQSYGLLLLALFVLGSGITLLQVSANPYVALLGPHGLGASKLTLVQAFNSLGTFLAPLFAAGFFMKIAGLTKNSLATMKPEELREALIAYVQMPYLILGVAFILLALLIGFSEIPVLDTADAQPSAKEEVNNSSGPYILKFPHVWMGALAIFLYVGIEVAIGQYLVSIYERNASSDFFIKFYWGAAMIGRFIGAGLLRVLSPRKGLAIFASSAVFLLLFYIIFRESDAGLWALSLIGLSNSILFPCIFTMGIDGMGKYAEESSALLNMAIVGGAIIPFLFSSVPFYLAFLLPVASYAFIIYYGLKGSRHRSINVVNGL
ncbi:MAG TPA: sugar MFS transporter [Cytophagaceae bacterium]|nr:sugar MFS transporter [Cytophagaceae bacterium]